ncbi:elongation factor 2 [Naegleria gruberi]|uniref:Elongation factor 2 n=1 Tax=Naegleria gruberi TaxID=5762 RepID=D2V235_NAEGR|nr:elongation factor 2 [Naegleria gruberi]EFC48983.1 elongation factor 2 [Naegleria gruberi]|eukprot:XP_002681727.1 elongation factor 2 [Naegleria gruberi strain NEG-M]
MINNNRKEKIDHLLRNYDNIRNISIIAHVDHGKSTLTRKLIEENKFADDLEANHDEIENNLSNDYSLIYENPTKKDDLHLVNLIDCPAFMNYQTVSAMNISDGTIIVVDAVEGHSPTQTLVRQVAQERVKPILFINKIDRLINELQLTEEESYRIIVRIIESVNVTLSAYSNEESNSYLLDPVDCNVVFGSARMGWAFNLNNFAQFYSSKFNISREKLIKKLWGDYYYDRSIKKFTRQPYSSTTGQQLNHTFSEFILAPIFKIFNLARAHIPSDQGMLSVGFEQTLDTLLIHLSREEKKGNSKQLIEVIMKKFLPLRKSLIQMIIDHLPSPKEAQKTKYDILYTGEDLTDPYATGIKECDPYGPLVVYVSKMLPPKCTYSGDSIALARVFSGSFSQSTTIRILGPNFKTKKDVFHTSAARLLLLSGTNIECIDRAYCGSIIGIVGLDKYFIKSCTFTEEGGVACMPIKGIRQYMSPIVSMSVEPTNPSDLPNFVERLKQLIQSNVNLSCKFNDSGQCVLGAESEYHLETCHLQEFTKDIQIKKSPYFVNFHETVSSYPSEEMLMRKSPNKHNRLYMQAEPISEDLIELISGDQFPMDEQEKIAEIMENDFGWDKTISKNIWSFGPDTHSRTNILVNASKSTSYLNEIQQYVTIGFQISTASGGLCDEVMRGVLFKLHDCHLHADSIHRGAGQLVGVSAKLMLASQLRAEPKLVEPMYHFEVQSNESFTSSVYRDIFNRRGNIINTTIINPSPLVVISGYLPVIESFGWDEKLREESQNQTFSQFRFSHWQVMQDDVYNPQSKANQLIKDVRIRKGLKEEIPLYTDYCDKL